MRRRGLIRIAIRHAIIILIIMSVALAVQSKNRKASEYERVLPQADEVTAQSSQVTSIETAKKPRKVQSIKNEEHENDSNYNLTAESEKPVWALRTTAQERYELAKIVMCEAEGESIITKALVALVVLNRVESKQFPDNIHDVIFQHDNGCYQFSPVMPEGRWWEVEPDDECFEVVEILCDGGIDDTSDGALYFESCTDEDNWHSRNLTYLFDSDNIRFYK